MLFSKYANPFLFMDQMIASGRFSEFVAEFINFENDRQIYEVWLHRVFDKTLSEFKKSMMPKTEIQKENLETTLKGSKNILSSFVPQQKGG